MRGAKVRGAKERGAEPNDLAPGAKVRGPEANPRAGPAKLLLGPLERKPELGCEPPLKLRPPLPPRICACKESEANNAIPIAMELSRRITLF